MKLFSFHNIGRATLDTVRRFPICVMAILFVFVLVQYQISSDAVSKNLRHPTIERLMVVGFLGALSFLGVYTWIESWKWTAPKKWILIGINTLFLLIFYYMLPADKLFDLQWKSTYVILGVILFLHLFISYIPYIKHDSVKDFWIYNKDILLKFLETSFFAAAIFVGLLLALVALDNLFGVDFEDKTFMRLFSFCGVLFHPLYFLSQFPQHYIDNDQQRPAKSYLIFCKYIMLPIVGLYFLILYAYAGKITLAWNLPKGWISQLILWFSVVGILAYLLNYYNDQYDDSPLIKWFKKGYFFILFPMMGLVYLALYVRWNDYGFTEPRYILMMLGIWLTILCLYFMISRKDDIRFIPISLSIMTLLSVMGPWSIHPVSINSQTSQLNNLLEKVSIIENGLYTNADNNVSRKNSSRIINILYYLDHRNALNVLRKYDSDALSIAEDTPISKLREIFHLDSDVYSPEGSHAYVAYNAKQQFNLNLSKAFDQLIVFNYYSRDENINVDSTQVKFVDSQAILYQDGKEICQISLLETIHKLGTTELPTRNDGIPLELTFDCERASGILVLQNISVLKTKMKIQLAEGMVLFRVK